MKLSENELRNILRESIKNVLSEGTPMERDAYTVGGNYSITTVNELKALFFDPKYTIAKGGIVRMTYVKAAKVNQGYNYNTQSGEDFEAQGRALNKKYVNDFYDSQEQQNKQYTGRGKGLRRPMAIFEFVTQDFQWAVERWAEKKRRESEIYDNASDSQMLDFIKKDPMTQKRLKQFIASHPEQEEEINQYLEMDTLPYEVARQIVDTKLGNAGGTWNKVDNSDYLYQHEKTNHEALRLTRSNKWKTQMRYAMVMNGEVKEISKEEYFHWRKVWNSDPKEATPQEELTDIAKSLGELNAEFLFNNYIIDNIVSLSFSLIDKATKEKKPVTFINSELVLSDGKTELPCDGAMLAKGVLPMAENKNVQTLTLEDIRNMVKESLNILLKESIRTTFNFSRKL